MSLDLTPIKERLANATPGGVHVADTDTMGDEDLDLIVNAPADLAALVAEVERLRQNIEKEIRAQVAADIWEYWDACGDLIDDRDSARQAIDAIAAQITKRATT